MGIKSQGAKMPTEKFREMIRLRELGRSQSEIAHSCNVARSTVQDYLRRAASKDLSYERLAQMSDSEAQALLGKGQRKSNAPKKAIAFEPIHQELAKKGVTLALLWQ
jgi:IS30 family transposase